MDSKLKNIRNQKLTNPSVELTCVIISLMLFALEDRNGLMNLLPQVFAAPGKKENLSIIESMLRKNLDQAVTFVCLAGLGEKLLRQEESARAKVSLIYLVSRALSEKVDAPDNKESRQLWSNVWSFGSQIPMVAAEMEEQEQNGNLKGWQSEVREFARRRWRTLKVEQMPRVKTQIKDLENRVLDFLYIEHNAPKDQ